MNIICRNYSGYLSNVLFNRNATMHFQNGMRWFFFLLLFIARFKWWSELLIIVKMLMNNVNRLKEYKSYFFHGCDNSTFSINICCGTTFVWETQVKQHIFGHLAEWSINGFCWYPKFWIFLLVQFRSECLNDCESK